MANSNKSKNNEDITAILGVVAANTMCIRKAISTAAKIGKTWIISAAAIAVAAAVLLNVPANFLHDNTWVYFVCYVSIIIFGLFAIIYPLSLLGELDSTTELVAENEQDLLGDDDDDD